MEEIQHFVLQIYILVRDMRYLKLRFVTFGSQACEETLNHPPIHVSALQLDLALIGQSMLP